MSKLEKPTSLHTAILNDDIELVKKYANTDLLNVSCKYTISDISFYFKCTPLHLSLLEGKTEIAEMLLNQEKININVKVQYILMSQKHVHTINYRPLDLAIQRSNLKIIDLLVSNPNLNLNSTDVKTLTKNLTTQHDEKYFNSLETILKKCEARLLDVKIETYQSRTTEQKNPCSRFFGGVPCAKKLAATNFLKDNLHQVLTIEKHKDYSLHEKALTQGFSSKKQKKINSSLCNLFLLIKEVELTVNKVKNPHEKGEQELKTFSPLLSGPR